MILVTGATGLIGTHLLYQLSLQDTPVRALYRTDESKQHVASVFSFFSKDSAALFQKITWVQADITDTPSLELAFEGVSKVYHIAALVSFNPKDYKKMRRINIEGTANVVNFCIEKNVQKLCFVSSIAAVGSAVNNKLITEENEWDEQVTNSPYAITKYGAELEVWRASQEGVPVVIVNPGVILGVGFWNQGSGKIIEQVAKGVPFYTTGITGFIGATDVSKVMLLLMNSSIQNERFILVSENNSFKDIFYTIADALQKKRPFIAIKAWVSAVVWRLDAVRVFLTRQTPVYTKSAAKAAHGTSYYSTKKIEKQLGIVFTPMETVLLEVCKHYPQ